MLSLLQYMTEKMGGAEGTQMDVDFVDMERVSIAAIIYSYTRIDSLKGHFYESELLNDMCQ